MKKAYNTNMKKNNRSELLCIFLRRYIFLVKNFVTSKLREKQ